MVQKLGLGFGSTMKACFVCGSYSHLIKECDFHEKKMAKKSVLKNMGKNTVLTRSERVPVSAAKQSSLKATASTSTFRPVNTATHTNRVNVSKLRTYAFHMSHSPIRRPFYKSTAPNTRISNEKVNTVRVNGVNTAGQTVVSTVKRTGVTAVKASAGCVWRPKMTDLNNGNPQQALKNKGIFDSGCSRHMTGNKDFLTDYQELDGGFVSFGGSTRGGKIIGKGKIRTDKLDFEDVFFVEELKFNLFSVSQMCDKKNSVLFTKTECLVLSPDFKLLDESQVLLRVPRQSNMYNFDLKNVVPSGGLTCLFAKATIDESKLWHRRLGHVNFKTMNKLVKGNLVRGLPSKIFDNDHTCVACLKGKQHKASCKAKLVSSISQPLQMLHMDLFGPTSVRSINHKTYCLVVTDDFSRAYDVDDFGHFQFSLCISSYGCRARNKKLAQAFDDETWVEANARRAVQLRFRRFFGLLVEPTFKKKAIGYKWSVNLHGQCIKSWIVVSNSTTEAEYISTSHCYGEVLWIQNQMLDYGYNFMQTKIHVDNESAICVVKNPVYHSKTKHIEIMHHFIRDSYDKKLIASINKKEWVIPGQTTTNKESSNPLMADSLLKTILPTKLIFCASLNMVAFLSNANGGSEEFIQIVDFLVVVIYSQYLKQFLADTTVETVNDGEQQITVIVDGQTIAITEASVRRYLQLADADGEHIPLFDSMLIHDQTGQGEGPTLTVESQHTPIASPTTLQPTTSITNVITEQPSQSPAWRERSQTTKKFMVKDSYKVAKEGQHLEDKLKVTQKERKEYEVFDAAKILVDASRERNTIAEHVQEKHSDTIKRYQTLKKKPVSVAQARKNMMIYLKNMAGYKMGYFKGMRYDEIRPIFEEEYNKTQTLFKKDTEVEKTKTKRITEETLLQKSFKKLRTAEASRSEPIQEQPTETKRII
ncbi:putative ribonuclease H-like domain-containing protein [Tanacetum coccineum]